MLATELSTRPFQVRLTLSPNMADLSPVISSKNQSIDPSWLVSLRTQLFKTHALLNQPCCQFVVVSTQLEHGQSMIEHAPVDGTLWIARLGRVQWTLQADIHQGNRLIATATQTGHQINSITHEPIWVSETLLQTYWDYQWSL